MNNILQLQKTLQFAIANNNIGNVITIDYIPSKLDVARFIQEQLAHLQFEVGELLEEIGDGSMSIVKPWSTRQEIFAKQQFTTNDRIKSEAIDVLCFCLNILLAAGITPENIEEEFNKVWNKNIKRQQEGY